MTAGSCSAGTAAAPPRTSYTLAHRLTGTARSGSDCLVVVNWCGHGPEFVPWPDKDGYWTLLPVVDAVANRTRPTAPAARPG
jgi:hypothetical protein